MHACQAVNPVVILPKEELVITGDPTEAERRPPDLSRLHLGSDENNSDHDGSIESNRSSNRSSMQDGTEGDIDTTDDNESDDDEYETVESEVCISVNVAYCVCLCCCMLLFIPFSSFCFLH